MSRDLLTPSRTLAAQLGSSRFTVTEAYARLAAEGFVDGRRTCRAHPLVAPTPRRPGP